MSIIQEIQKWAPVLPVWQQDAVSRLFEKRELAAEDYDDFYALLKAEHGIPDPKGRIPKKLTAEQVVAAQKPDTLIQIAAVKNLRNVNALAQNQNLSFSLRGLTVIYGDNGSGKSGYSRVLKKACRARDQSEAILPDAKLPSNAVGRPEAAFDLLIDGVATEAKWLDDETAPEPLSAIAIFDSRCARAYLDEQDDFSYVPYGLDILEGLAKACVRLKEMLKIEQNQVAVNLAAFDPLAKTPTAVGRLLSTLSAKTKPEDVEALADLNETEIGQHAALERSLKEGNPKEKAQQVKLRAGRILKLAERCAEKLARVGNAEASRLRALVNSYQSVKAAAELAARQFKETPGQLPGTGGEAWQALFEAARKFAVESHPGKEFPHLGPEAGCPLCQQPLGAAAQRLVAFEAFIQQEAEKLARGKRGEAMAAYTTLDKADLSIGFDSELNAELTALDPELTKACECLQSAIKTRRESIKAACGGKVAWESIGIEPPDVSTGLKALAANLIAEAESLEKASDEKARLALEKQFKELEARQALGSIKAGVLEAIEKLQRQKKLKSCQAGVRTNAISIKSTELTEQFVSAELADALNAEFKKLNVGELHVSLKSLTQKGKAYHKLVLQLPGAEQPSSILSEGEQRAIAIASFLAEVNVGGGKNGVVFDDPVSSLDHRRRELVASRLAEEAKARQVIVFTHDVYFLCILQQTAERLGVEIATRSLHKRPEGFGVADAELPFEGAKTSTRIGMLRQMHVKCEQLYKAGDEKECRSWTRDAYFHLRLAWERAVEEVLLRSVVIRFREGVETNKLIEVVVEHSDYAAVERGMTKCSKYAHDKAALGNVAVPLPAELADDITALELWRKAIEARSTKTRKLRKQALTGSGGDASVTSDASASTG